MIKWPERAKAAIKKLFEPLQDIDVYVEDSNDEAFYRTLLNRVSQGRVHIARVFSLGCRAAVIEAAQQHDHSKRRALFIIDGDLEWVRGLPPPKCAWLHCHEAYCIENLLICERALSQILAQEIIVTEDDAVRILDFKGWIKSIQNPLLELFSAFATVHEFAPERKTIGRGVGVMCTKHGSKGITVLDALKVGRATTEALAVAEGKAGKSKVKTAYRKTLARLKALTFPLHAVSGKDFLLPLLDFWLQSFGCRIKRKSLRMRMASGGDIHRFADLSVALQNAAHGRA
ncbi:MAG: DUF4435 domain-containing protein [Syntrophales bacterium]|nr:DUF4435 domain-containing protein [Syntrophales bacterium]